MQETFMYLLRKFPGFQLTAKLRTFLYPAVRHIALALRSKRNATDGGTAISNEQAAGADVPADLAALNEALQLLDSGQREVLMLRFADDLSLQEIAEAMALPLGTVKSRLHYALQTLREHPKLRDYFS